LNNEVDEMKWQEHEERIVKLEEEQKQYRLELGDLKNQVGNVNSEIKLVQANVGTLQNTVERTSTDQMGLLKTLVEGKQARELAEQDNKTKISIAQLDTKTKIITGLAGTGGVTAVILGISELVKLFQ